MIKQDYLIRMIQEIASLIMNTILFKKKIVQEDWSVYNSLLKEILGFPPEALAGMDMQELIDKYEGKQNKIEKIELAAMTMLKISYEMDQTLLLQSKLRQDGITLLKYVSKESNTFSVQREQLIMQLEINN